MSDNSALIAEARVRAPQSGALDAPAWRDLTWRLIDALEADE